MLFAFGFVAAFVGMNITPEQPLARFPDISAARTVENSLYLVVLLLWVKASRGRSAPRAVARRSARGQRGGRRGLSQSQTCSG